MHDTPDIPAAKAALRHQSKERRAALPQALRTTAARRLVPEASRLVALAGTVAGHAPPVIAGFMPFGAEIDPGPLMQAVADLGAHLAVPRLDGGEISFHRYDALTRFQPGVFGIREPHADTPHARPHLMLTPLLAFDRYGHRLGYGRGYYDRAIGRNGAAVTVGIAFAAQAAEAVPVEPHDRRLDFVLTEDGLIDCRR